MGIILLMAEALPNFQMKLEKEYLKKCVENEIRVIGKYIQKKNVKESASKHLRQEIRTISASILKKKEKE